MIEGGAAVGEEGSPARSRSGGLVAVRVRRPDEMLLIRPLAEEFHRESRYGQIPFSERKFKRQFLQTLNNPDDTLGAYVRHCDKVVGLLQAGAGDYYLGEGGRMVTVLTFYVPRSVRDSMLGGRVTLKMMRIVSDWAKAQGALELHMHSTSGIAPQRTDRMLRRLGFKTYGGSYVMGVGS